MEPYETLYLLCYSPKHIGQLKKDNHYFRDNETLHRSVGMYSGVGEELYCHAIQYHSDAMRKAYSFEYRPDLGDKIEIYFYRLEREKTYFLDINLIELDNAQVNCTKEES